MPAQVGPVELLVLQPTPFCNIECQYCYLGERSFRGRMSLETAIVAFRRLFESPYLANHLDVAWHGGEPLTVPLQWYRQVLQEIGRLKPGTTTIRHNFQTNGLLLSPAWVDFFLETKARVGISIDGPPDIHDFNRVTRNGIGTHASAARAVRLLQKAGLDFHIICVLTARSLPHPERIVEYFCQLGVHNVGFNIDEVEGNHTHSSLSGSPAEEDLRHFIEVVLDGLGTRRDTLKIREVESATAAIVTSRPAFDPQSHPLSIVNIGWDGSISTFSPELHGTRHTRFPRFVFGNVHTHELSDVLGNPLFLSIYAEVQSGVDACARGCKYFPYCGGGAPANKLYESGRFDVAETTYCRLTRQVWLDGVAGHLLRKTQANT